MPQTTAVPPNKRYVLPTNWPFALLLGAPMRKSSRPSPLMSPAEATEKPAGSYEIVFEATALPSGIYFYQLQAGDIIETKKMVYLK